MNQSVMHIHFFSKQEANLLLFLEVIFSKTPRNITNLKFAKHQRQLHSEGIETATIDLTFVAFANRELRREGRPPCQAPLFEIYLAALNYLLYGYPNYGSIKWTRKTTIN